ncbi:MAG: PKD domain-containing protein [Niabella sp.]|nr:PKD domain-containing protein [Niabella sp.]
MQKKQFMVFRLDDNVIITLLAVCTLASMAFIVRYRSYKPCKDFSINTVGTILTVGHIVRFETDAKDFKRLSWDFGDNQKSETEVASALHSFDDPGNYTIALLADGKCVEYKTITVVAAPEVIDSSLVAKVVMPATAIVGAPVLFKDTSSKASSWEWRFGETAVVDGVLRNQVYTFTTPGIKTISVVINGNYKTPLVRKIYVSPKEERNIPVAVAQPRPRVNERPNTDPLTQQINPQPQQQPQEAPPPPPTPSYPDVAPADLNQMFRNAAGGGKPISDFAKYFCDGNLNTTVILNGKSVSFQQFYNKVAAVKRGDKLTFTTTVFKNRQTNCINKLEIIGKVKAGMFNMSWRDL